ncbi:hypothetical protein AYK24_00190 [Thermoplasmatales archaeon SG8-52-4]|nr:MAG: hypothetical protein AYK24_00190 [Thermoplasmatales archaeon SG8-52-4]
MKYFKKLAAGPPVIFKVHPKNPEVKGAYIMPRREWEVYRITQDEALANKVRKKGAILINPAIKDPEHIKKIKRHELVHYLRHKNRQWSSMNYGALPGARFVEETAAYGKVHGSKIKGMLHAMKSSKPIRAVGKLLH